MKKIFVLGLISLLTITSCGPNKELLAAQKELKTTQDLLNTATVKLNSCLSDKAVADASLDALKEQLVDLRKTNDALFSSTKEMTVLTTKGAENLEKTLESLQERDLKISRLQDAVNKKDSVTLAIVSSLKKSVGIDDPDIEINVEKGVVFISISDKLLFKSGSYFVTEKAKVVLGKVAKVINDKPDFEAMIEGHTDSRSYASGNLEVRRLSQRAGLQSSGGAGGLVLPATTAVVRLVPVPVHTRVSKKLYHHMIVRQTHTVYRV